MPAEQFSIPSYALEYLRGRGYAPDTAMSGFVNTWWGWYAGDAESEGEAKDFYDVPYTDPNGTRKHRKRLSLRPARRVCREWASLLLNDETQISVADETANRWLNGANGEDGRERGYLERHSFWAVSQDMVEKAFALGTGAWALWFDVGDDATEVKARTYDARMVVPLSWDDDGVTECAFCTRTTARGEAAYQVQMHLLDADTGTYAIETVVFVDGNEADAGEFGFMPRFDTGCPTPTFAIVRPGIANTCADVSPFGQSVFHDGIDAVKAVDLTWDAFMQEVELTGVMVFMDESMIDVRDERGKLIPVPRGGDDRMFRKVAGQGASELYEVFSPEIRADPLYRAFDTALSQLGDQCGFGQQYFTLGKSGGVKTATEVSSDNSALMRSIRKHEVALGAAIAQIVASLLTCARIHCGADVPGDFGEVQVFFDDSIITDTQTDKAMMLNEIAAGVVPKWMYLREFYGMSEEEAKALAGGEVPDMGF